MTHALARSAAALLTVLLAATLAPAQITEPPRAEKVTPMHDRIRQRRIDLANVTSAADTRLVIQTAHQYVCVAQHVRGRVIEVIVVLLGQCTVNDSGT